ncbi:hypothetical protein SAMN05444161_1666 [Rhizobiales bacterium GAS191]|nr:hypothetical protein SAMN05444161_1666 [Rhizobiales bacterium GAS191]
MVEKLQAAVSPDAARLIEKMRGKKYRDAYVSSHGRQFLAAQFRALRGEQSQTEFGKVIGKKQAVVSRLEDPSEGHSLQTVYEVAAQLNRAVFVRVVDFPTFIRLTADKSESAVAPEAYSDHAMDALVKNMRVADSIKRGDAFEAAATAQGQWSALDRDKQNEPARPPRPSLSAAQRASDQLGAERALAHALS